MSDSTLNAFVARGSSTNRAAFTPSVPVPASGPGQGYYWFEEDTGKLFAWNNTGTPAWQKVMAVPIPLPITTQTASYTLVLADANSYIRMNDGSGNNLTVPANSSVAFPVGTEVTIFQKGAGTTTIVADTGVTINSPKTLVLAAQYAAVTLKKVGTDEWDLLGYTG